METAGVLQRFTHAYGERFTVQKTGARQFCGVVTNVDVASGRALEVKRINLRGLA
jgi:calcineurin-like phosphoesterase